MRPIALTGLRAARPPRRATTSSAPQGQDFVVDVVLELDLGPAAATDDVADTVHYGELAGRLVAIVTGEPVNLIETLADRLLDGLPGRPAGARGHGHRAQAAGADRRTRSPTSR